MCAVICNCVRGYSVQVPLSSSEGVYPLRYTIEIHFWINVHKSVVAILLMYSSTAAACTPLATLHGGRNFSLPPRSSCAVLRFQFVRRAEPARQPTAPAATVQTLRGGQMLELCRAVRRRSYHEMFLFCRYFSPGPETRLDRRVWTSATICA